MNPEYSYGFYFKLLFVVFSKLIRGKLFQGSKCISRQSQFIYIFVETRYYALLTKLAARYIATLEIEVLTNQALPFAKKDKNIKVVTKEDK